MTKTKLNWVQITNRVSAVCEVGSDIIRGPSRSARACEARGLAMLILRGRRMTLNQIGRCFNGRDHATVIHSLYTTRDRLKKNPIVKRQYKLIMRLIESDEGKEVKS